MDNHAAFPVSFENNSMNVPLHSVAANNEANQTDRGAPQYEVRLAVLVSSRPMTGDFTPRSSLKVAILCVLGSGWLLSPGKRANRAVSQPRMAEVMPWQTRADAWAALHRNWEADWIRTQRSRRSGGHELPQ